MTNRTLLIFATLTTLAALFSLAPSVSAAPPVGLSSNTFPPSFYGFNPGYYGPYYPGHYQYGNVQPGTYNNYANPRFSGYGQNYYGTSSSVPVPYSYQLYGSSSTFGLSPSPYVPPVTSSGYRVPNLSRPGSRAAAQDDTTVLGEVRLPTPDAELWVEGRKTASTGTWRQFRSPPLVRGAHYVYEFRARWFENGHEVTRTRKVPVQAGEGFMVDFTTPLWGEAESVAPSGAGSAR